MKSLDDGTAAPFFTLYCHLNPESVGALTAGQPIEKGQAFAAFSKQQNNGGWPPHLHFQTGLISTDPNWPGAVDPDELDFWSKLYPNPAAILNLDDEQLAYQPPSKADVLALRCSTLLKMSTCRKTPNRWGINL